MMILAAVQGFLNRVRDDPSEISDDIVEEFGNACKNVFRKQFIEQREKGFRLRMSNIGRPLCQLQMEKSQTKTDGQSYNTLFRNLYGDMIEAAAIAIMKAAGVDIQSQHEEVSLNVAGTIVKGTLDLVIDGRIWDVKSASPWSFDHKFTSFEAVVNDDAFGYLSQIVGYAEAKNRPFGGWIVINKVTGEWRVIEAPVFSDEVRKTALENIYNTTKAIMTDRPFERCFTDIPEKFRKKETGNKILEMPCRMCAYKEACWPRLEYRPAIKSEAANPAWHFYTSIDPIYDRKENA